MSHTIGLVDLARRHAAHAEEIESRVLSVLRSGRYIGGPVVAQLEREVARWMRTAHAVGVGSGTDGLRLALQAVGVQPGDEVIVPAMSFFATAGAVLQLGATPVVVDVQKDCPDGCLCGSSCSDGQDQCSGTRPPIWVWLYAAQG